MISRSSRGNLIVVYLAMKFLVSFSDPKVDDHVTERRGRVVSTPASYPGYPGSQISAWRPDFVTECFRNCPQSLHINAGIVP
jgi:hypothetical protein